MSPTNAQNNANIARNVYIFLKVGKIDVDNQKRSNFPK